QPGPGAAPLRPLERGRARRPGRGVSGARDRAGARPGWPAPAPPPPWPRRFCDNAAGARPARDPEFPRMLVIGVAGTELTAQERDWLQHDAVAGVILFARNFASRAQVAELAAAIREAAPRPQLLCVDQEGGRVQRFREGYSALPPLQALGELYARDPEAALARAEEHAWLM